MLAKSIRRILSTKQLKNNDLCTISNKSLFFTNTENGLHAPLFTSYYGLEDSNTTSVI